MHLVARGVPKIIRRTKSAEIINAEKHQYDFNKSMNVSSFLVELNVCSSSHCPLIPSCHFQDNEGVKGVNTGCLQRLFLI